MSASHLVRRATTLVVAACAVVAIAPVSLTSVHANTDRLRVNFDTDAPAGTVLMAGAPIADLSGQGNNGTVATQYGGSVAMAAGPTGVTADFPGKCKNEPCPNALVDIPDNVSLDPLLADFQWGARILMRSTETADGENVLQKGRFGEVGGQWKLQVDKAAGIPSCLVSGKVPGNTTEREVLVHASIGVANGAWHQVTCRRTAAAGVQIIIDGVVRGTTAMPLVMLASTAHVTIGAKDIEGSDNDQFLGVLDDAFMTVLNDAPVPNDPPTAAFTSGCVDLFCTFDASSSTDNGWLTYAWDFGDGGSAVGVNPVHTFAVQGDHLVTLTVTDGPGLTSSITRTITIADNTPPNAAFSSACVDLGCTFDASGSTDDGPITYAWDFGDGGIAAGVNPSHTFAGAGGHVVTLTVTDGAGQTGSVVHTVSVTQPAPPPVSFVAQSSVSANVLKHVANVPTAVHAGDVMLMFFSIATDATVQQPTGVTGWVQVDSLSAANGSTRVWRKVATAADAGVQVKINISAVSKGNITIVAYRGASLTNPIASFARLMTTTSSALRTTPTANVAVSSVVVSYWMHRDSATTALTQPAGVTARATGTEVGGGHVTVLTADSGTAVAVGTYGGLTAQASTVGPLATTWTIVLAPA